MVNADQVTGYVLAGGRATRTASGAKRVSIIWRGRIAGTEGIVCVSRRTRIVGWRRTATGAANGLRNCCLNFPSNISAVRPHLPCLAGKEDGLKLRAVLLLTRNTCCWTNPLQALTRFQLSISRKSYRIWPARILAF